MKPVCIQLFTPLVLLAAVLLTLSGCSRDTEKTSIQDNSAEVEAYYAAHPEFFVTKTLADLPKDLKWTNGGDLPEIGSPNRKRGGIWNGRIQDFPRTLRIIGPDSNSGFRAYLQDDFALSFAGLHPNVPGPHQYYPALATEWAIDLPNRTVYVKIDPAARWSDGPPVTTDDVFFGFWFHQSPYIQAPWYNNYYGIGENYTRITRYDTHTFSVTLKEARPDLPSRVLGLAPTPRHFYKEAGPDFVTRYNWRFAPTTGAYVLTPAELKRTATNRNNITFARLDNWWANDKPYFRYRYNPSKIRLRVIRETTTAWEAFLSGELDLFGLGLAEYYYDRLPDSDPLVQRGLIQKTVFYNDIPRPNLALWMNTAKPLLANREIRLGIQYAANWQLVIDQYFRGDYTRMNTTADGFGIMTDPDIHARPFDIQRATEHFAKAGYTKRGPDGILLNDRGERLAVTITTGYDHLAPVLTILQQEARKAGLHFEIEILNASTAWKKVQEKNHDITFTGFNVGVEMFPRYWEFFHSANAYDQPYLADGKTPNPDRKPKVQTNNLQSIAIPELDALITAYDKSDDLGAMRKMAWRMEEIIYEDGSFSPAYAMPFYRTGSWRWVGWPEGFNVRYSTDPLEAAVHWIDEDQKKETLKVRHSEEKFPVSIKTYDQWKARP